MIIFLDVQTNCQVKQSVDQTLAKMFRHDHYSPPYLVKNLISLFTVIFHNIVKVYMCVHIQK